MEGAPKVVVSVPSSRFHFRPRDGCSLVVAIAALSQQPSHGVMWNRDVSCVCVTEGARFPPSPRTPAVPATATARPGRGRDGRAISDGRTSLTGAVKGKGSRVIVFRTLSLDFVLRSCPSIA